MKQVLVYSLLSIFFLIIQTIIPPWLSLTFPIPDISFIILVYLGFNYGPMFGQICGFFLGLSIDFMTLSPLGFHALLFTLTGHLIGRGKGMVQLDLVLIPMALMLISTIIKTLVTVIFAYLLGQAAVLGNLLSWVWFTEIVFTILITWLVVLLLNLLDRVLNKKRSIL